jgi:hypothetical protein
MHFSTEQVTGSWKQKLTHLEARVGSAHSEQVSIMHRLHECKRKCSKVLEATQYATTSDFAAALLLESRQCGYSPTSDFTAAL